MEKEKVTQEKDQQQQKKKRSRTIKIVLVIGFVVYVGFTLINQQITLNTQKQQLSDLQQEEGDLQKQEALLQDKLDHMDSEEYIEQQARDKLGWVKDGEIKFVDPGDESTQDQQDESATNKPQTSDTPQSSEPQISGEPQTSSGQE